MRLAPETPLTNICEDLKISTPKYLNEETRDRTEQMTLEAIEVKVALEDFGNMWLNRDHKAVLIFLYGRKFYDDQAPEKRRNTIRDILTCATATDRMLKIAAKDGDSDLLLEEEHGEQPVEEGQHVAPPVEGMPMRTTIKNPFNMWMSRVEDWASDDGAVTISSKFGVQLVLRRQLSSNCFIHAPGVLQGYLVQKGTKSFLGMIDLTKFIRDCAEDEFLASLVLTDDGGMSVGLLETLLHGTPCFLSFRLRDPETNQEKEDASKKICESFKNHGPALISECNLDQQFRDFQQVVGNVNDPFDLYEIPSFDDYIPSSESGKHAMVLVGYRENGDGCTFLLQNWWRDMQFCEVSVDYLMKSKAKFTFCSTEQHYFGTGQQINHFKSAEAKFHDRADGFHKLLEVSKIFLPKNHNCTRS
jgi:hypothetical protein